MFDIGFWELLVIAVVLLLVMGPERLPEVARQAAFLVRKIRQGVFRLRNEMQNEIDSTPFADLQKARQEVTDFKNDIKQFGRELVDSTQDIGVKDGTIEASAADGDPKSQAEPASSATTPVNRVTNTDNSSDAEKSSGKTPPPSA